jgi:SAM-dependent methyltransferase
MVFKRKKRRDMFKKRTKEEDKAFWDKRAKTFPRFSDEEKGDDLVILDAARQMGAEFSGKSVLDVSSGTGRHAIRMAQMGAKVTALDISPEMLKILKDDAKARGVEDISIIVSDFMDYEFKETYDVVFCAMSPAINDDMARNKLISLSKEFMVFVGFSKFTNPSVISSLLTKYDIPPKDFKSTEEMKRFLNERKYRFLTFGKKGEWITRSSKSELLDYVKTIMEDYEKDFSDSELLSHIEDYREPGGESYLTVKPYELEVVVCVIES